jgi:glutathione synthase/RimK-type ligase-like ATP-grasp enzyme
MKHLLVLDDPKEWPLHIDGVEVCSAKSYLTCDDPGKKRGVRVYNLCKSYRYQTLGYYVSLLASARGHKPIPSVSTIQELKSKPILKTVTEELDQLIQKSLHDLKTSDFTLSIYFGHNLAKRYDRLSAHLYSIFQAPLLRAYFHRDSTGESQAPHWRLISIKPVSGMEIPPEHYDFVQAAAKNYFAGKKVGTKKRSDLQFDIAILIDPTDPEGPSNTKAIEKFCKAAIDLGLNPEIITKEDFGRIAEFDALFIRETTSVKHHTFRFAQRAAMEGLVVIDDPESILRCTNKIYLAELLSTHHIRTPRTLIVHRENVGDVAKTIGFPCILKQPDSAFSQGVTKARDAEELVEKLEQLWTTSDLVIAQEFLPTEFDWRIGILDRKPIYACKYYMAPNHWQIIKREQSTAREIDGRVVTFPLEDVPPKVVAAALKSANLVGDGLYGVDLKEIDGKPFVIEVNDNPNIDHGYEDTILKNALYTQVMSVFRERIERRKLRLHS